jgi:hypothetical protein
LRRLAKGVFWRRPLWPQSRVDWQQRAGQSHIYAGNCSGESPVGQLPDVAASDDNLGLMRRIDELTMARPLLGLQRMARTLGEDGVPINRKRV